MRRFKILSCGGVTEETNLLIYVVYGRGFVPLPNLLRSISMCLETLQNFKVKLNKDGIGIGYKVFKLKAGALYGEIVRKEKVRRVGVWLKERNFRAPKGSNLKMINGKYKEGWHIFLRRRSAYDWGIEEGLVIKRIRFRGIVAKGRNVDRNRVIVAKEIFIPKEMKNA